MKKKIFEYAILLHPTADEGKEGKGTVMLVPPTAVLAADQNAAMMLAARAIPEEHLSCIDRIEVAVVPF